MSYIGSGYPVGSVAHEAWRLDRIFDGWWMGIDEERLVALMDANSCVLGQGVVGQGMAADYGAASGAVQYDARGREEDIDSILGPYLFDEFIPEWKNEVRIRRRASRASG